MSIPATEKEGGDTSERQRPRTAGAAVFFLTLTLTDAQQDEPRMSQVKVGKQVNEVEGHERKAEDDADPFLTSFA